MKTEITGWRKDFRLIFFDRKDGEHRFSYTIDETFFSHFPVEDIKSSRMNVEVLMTKTDRLMRLEMIFSGEVLVECGMSLEDFWMPLQFETLLVAKFDADTSIDDDVWLVDRAAHHLDLADYFYEMIVLQLPARRVNPKVLSGEISSTVYEAYKKLQTEQGESEAADEPSGDPVDPRWQKLKGLIKE